jgi:hypothetical protein
MTTHSLLELEEVLVRNRVRDAKSATFLVQTIRETFVESIFQSGSKAKFDFALPDIRDEHLLECALIAACEFIVTFNLRDFPDSVLEVRNLVAITPDQYLMDLVDNIGVEIATKEVKDLLVGYKNPVLTAHDFAHRLLRSNCPRIAEWTVRHIH